MINPVEVLKRPAREPLAYRLLIVRLFGVMLLGVIGTMASLMVVKWYPWGAPIERIQVVFETPNQIVQGSLAKGYTIAVKTRDCPANVHWVALDRVGAPIPLIVGRLPDDIEDDAVPSSPLSSNPQIVPRSRRAVGDSSPMAFAMMAYPPPGDYDVYIVVNHICTDGNYRTISDAARIRIIPAIPSMPNGARTSYGYTVRIVEAPPASKPAKVP